MGPVMDMAIRPPTRAMVILRPTRITRITIPITPTVTRIGAGAGAAVGGVVAVSGDAVSGDAVSPGAFTAGAFTAGAFTAADTAITDGRCRCWTGKRLLRISVVSCPTVRSPNCLTTTGVRSATITI